MRHGRGTAGGGWSTPATRGVSRDNRDRRPFYLPAVLVASMDRHACSWCENSPSPRGLIPPCLPTPAQKPPSGSAWVHEIKHDGYRLIARRDGNRVRLYTRRGYDWSGKYPWIVELASVPSGPLNRRGRGSGLGWNGKSDFDRPHSGAHDDTVLLYGFDLLELNGED